MNVSIPIREVCEAILKKMNKGKVPGPDGLLVFPYNLLGEVFYKVSHQILHFSGLGAITQVHGCTGFTQTKMLGPASVLFSFLTMRSVIGKGIGIDTIKYTYCMQVLNISATFTFPEMFPAVFIYFFKQSAHLQMSQFSHLNPLIFLTPSLFLISFALIFWCWLCLAVLELQWCHLSELSCLIPTTAAAVSRGNGRKSLGFLFHSPRPKHPLIPSSIFFQSSFE